MKLTVKNILWFYAFLLIGLSYFFGLFIDLTGDSGLYAAISRQMVESGDWLNLKINGESYDQKPHLLFWLTGIGIKLFGNTNFAFKIFPSLWAFAGIYFTYRLGKLMFSDETGKWAALIAGTSQIFFLYIFDIHTDSVLQTGVTLALWQLAEYLKRKRTSGFIFGFLGIGLAMLSKGPVGAIIPFFAVLLYLIIIKDFKQVFHLKWLLGILIVFVVISPALLQLFNNFGWGGIRFYFITNNFGRVSGKYAGSSTDYAFYLHTLLWAFLPWTVLVVFALFSEIKDWIKSKKENIWGIYLLGSVFILVFILSVAKGKAPNYLLITIPPISVIAGKWIATIKNLSKGKEKILFYTHQVLLLVLVILFFAIVFILAKGNFWLSIILIILSSASVYILFKIQQEGLLTVILSTLIIFGTLTVYMNSTVLPGLFKYQGARQALKIYEQKREDNDILKNLQLEEFELFYWANAPVEEFTTWDEFYLFLEKKGAWVYTGETGYEVILKLKDRVETVYEIPQRGMNKLSFSFILPSTRKSSLNNNYLIKIQ